MTLICMMLQDKGENMSCLEGGAATFQLEERKFNLILPVEAECEFFLAEGVQVPAYERVVLKVGKFLLKSLSEVRTFF